MSKYKEIDKEYFLGADGFTNNEEFANVMADLCNTKRKYPMQFSNKEMIKEIAPLFIKYIGEWLEYEKDIGTIKITSIGELKKRHSELFVD